MRHRFARAPRTWYPKKRSQSLPSPIEGTEEGSLMSRRTRWVVCVVANISLLMLYSPSFAQQDVYQEEGTVADVGEAGLLVADTKNNRVWVQPNPMAACKVTVAGTAEPGFLKSGLFVRFEAKLDKQGNVKEDVTKLAIVVLSENNQLRLDPDIG